MDQKSAARRRLRCFLCQLVTGVKESKISHEGGKERQDKSEL
jgi:hypothetical protein